MYTLASCQQLTRGDGGWPTAFVVVDGSAEVEILFFLSFFLLFQHELRWHVPDYWCRDKNRMR
jgi:hypothetical protein